MKLVGSTRLLDPPTLSDHIEIKMEGPTVDKFSAEHSVSLWWEDSKTGRRMKQRPRKQPHAWMQRQRVMKSQK